MKYESIMNLNRSYRQIKYNFSNPKKIFPQDDSYKKNHNLFNMEWWHFEASFNNGISFYYGISLYSIKNCGFIISNIKLYQNGKLKTKDHDFFLFPNFVTSFDYPLIKIQDKILIKFDDKLYNDTGIWKYSLLINNKKSRLDLSFSSISYGYKTKSIYFHNIISQPKAIVKGLIKVDDEEEQVIGKGYHNRIWRVTPNFYLKNVGFFSGSVLGNTLSLVWDRTVNDLYNGHTLMRIFDDKNKKAYTIQSELITFILNDFIRYKNKLIPKKFIIKSDCIIDNKPLSIDIEMEIKEIDQENFFNLHYLILHLITNGKITFGSQEELFQKNICITEYPLFKSLSKIDKKKIYWK